MKDFLAIGPFNAVHYKQVFPLIKAGTVHLGAGGRIPAFTVLGGEERKFGNTIWFTTLSHDHINPPLMLTATYTPEAYPKYDNYDAIEVSRTKDIPRDYYGVMGVPLTFIERWCPEQFEIVGITAHWSELRTKRYGMVDIVHPDGRRTRHDSLDAGAAVEVAEPPAGWACYVAGGRLYIGLYIRLLVRRKKLE